MNYPSCSLVSDDAGNSIIVAVTSGSYDGIKGCLYTLHSPRGELLSSGQSQGVEGSGAGSALTAMKLGRAAAKRLLLRNAKRAAEQHGVAAPADGLAKADANNYFQTR